MKKIANYITIFLLSIFIISCGGSNESISDSPENTPNNTSSKNKILCLGASRVEGARPEYESFRYELWKDLIDGGFTFDFVGTQEDNASYPNYQGKSFDKDHEGRGGWKSGQIVNGISNWLNQTGAPDIVLFSAPAGNDALAGDDYTTALNNVKAIVDAIQKKNPNVTILIEELAPAKTFLMTPNLTAFFTQMHQDVKTIATTKSTATSKVIAVDMHTGFTDSLLADEVHYNTAGAAFIAERYYDVLEDLLVK